MSHEFGRYAHIPTPSYESTIQHTDKRSEMQLDEVDLYLESILGYTLQPIQTPDISSWKMVMRTGELVSVDANHPKTYSRFRKEVGDALLIRKQLNAKFEPNFQLKPKSS